MLDNLARLVPGVIYQYRLFPDGRSAFPYASPGMNDIYEVTPEEVREDATPVFGRLHPDDRNMVSTAIFESARTLETFYCEFRVILPRQGLRWRWSQAHPERTEDGGTLWHGIISDITERKQAEDALRASEAFNAAMIACSPVALYSIDTNGNVQSWNPSAERVFGWKAEEVIGKPLPIVSEDQMEFFTELKNKVLAGHTIIGLEVNRLRKDGSLFTGRLSTSPILDATGTVVGILGAMEDISESKKLEEQLNQAQKMESVGRLAGGVAHDFNNMLNVILGNADLMLEDLPADSPLRAEIKEIQKAGQRSADLTRQLLAFARRQTITPKVLDLNETVESMLKMLRRLIGEDIDLLWKPAKVLAPVRIDPSQIDQILANLCVNARDAIGHNVGKVTIETKQFSFDEEYCADHAGFAAGHYVMLAVSDDGCGMDHATKAQIFEPFFTTKGVGEGTGLGLATVYGIVKQNNGFINVYSEPGQGTTFRVYFSVHKSAKPEQTLIQTATAPLPRGNETVLVVEDEPSLLKMSQIMLGRLGYTVLAAHTPTEAIRLAEEHAGEIHLLMTDVVMPGMNGRDLAASLLSLYPNLKRLFMSGYTANVIAHQGVLDEGVNFIQKPFSQRDLALKVQEALVS